MKKSESNPDIRRGIGIKGSATSLSRQLSFPSRGSALDISSTDPIFVSGTQALAKILQIVPNHDPTVLLTAVRIVIQEKLSESAISKGNKDNAVSKEDILNLIPWEAVLFVHVLGVWLLFTNAIPWFSDFSLPLLLFS